MAKLALAVGEETRLGPDRVGFRLSSRTALVAHRAFGQSIIVYRAVPDSVVMFIGSGRILGLDFEAPGFEILRVGEYRAFAAPLPSDLVGEARDPGVRRSLSLTDERFEDILQAATASDINAQALAEAAAVFAQDREAGLDAYVKVHDRVMQRWKYRCVFTGTQFEPTNTRPHPHLSVVAIRPRELGGPLHVRNYLPMVAEAEHAWTHGHLTLGPGFGFQVSERLIDPEFHERLLPLGKLDLPAEPSRWPDPELVAYHRTHIFDRD